MLEINTLLTLKWGTFQLIATESICAKGLASNSECFKFNAERMVRKSSAPGREEKRFVACPKARTNGRNPLQAGGVVIWRLRRRRWSWVCCRCEVVVG